MVEYQDALVDKKRAARNRTLTVTEMEAAELRPRLLAKESLSAAPSGIVWADFLEIASLLPDNFVDLLFLDPPYNLNKNFHGVDFRKSGVDAYSEWLAQVIEKTIRLLKPDASIYICGDWLTSTSIFATASSYFTIQNRITWEREKGRGAKNNWKNCCEDVWFCTMDKANYKFHADAVKLRRRVIAPYRDDSGRPKDWKATDGGNFRDTAPSNIWTDLTIPFWSMPENTDHPTQKSEKMLAKIILASSDTGDFVLDPFVGSGTTAVVAKKLNRNYLGIDVNELYCLWGQKRLELAEKDKDIQGFSEGVFWERNTLQLQQAKREQVDQKEKGLQSDAATDSLFD